MGWPGRSGEESDQGGMFGEEGWEWATIGEVREHAWLSGWRGVGAMMKVMEKMKEE